MHAVSTSQIAAILHFNDNSIIRDKGHVVAYINYAPFTKCIIEIDETTIDDAEDLDIVMLMNNLLV